MSVARAIRCCTGKRTNSARLQGKDGCVESGKLWKFPAAAVPVESGKYATYKVATYFPHFHEDRHCQYGLFQRRGMYQCDVDGCSSQAKWISMTPTIVRCTGVHIRCGRHLLDQGYCIEVKQWFTGPEDFHRPGKLYTMREHISEKTNGPAVVAWVDEVLAELAI